jgi:hypothetical protein
MFLGVPERALRAETYSWNIFGLVHGSFQESTAKILISYIQNLWLRIGLNIVFFEIFNFMDENHHFR